MKAKIYITLAAIVGIFIGWLLFRGTYQQDHNHEQADNTTIWTCAMHPQIRQSEPGICPICSMDQHH